MAISQIEINNNSPGSRLFYYGTNIEVRLGDRVRWKRWFRSDIEGTVCYIPGISRLNPSLENSYIKEWAIKTDDGTIWTMVYDPKHGQPMKNLKFVARTDQAGISPETVVD